MAILRASFKVGADRRWGDEFQIWYVNQANMGDLNWGGGMQFEVVARVSRLKSFHFVGG